jgi:hypothetical protein
MLSKAFLCYRGANRRPDMKTLIFADYMLIWQKHEKEIEEKLK